jgi:hypothetical protein
MQDRVDDQEQRAARHPLAQEAQDGFGSYLAQESLLGHKLPPYAHRAYVAGFLDAIDRLDGQMRRRAQHEVWVDGLSKERHVI